MRDDRQRLLDIQEAIAQIERYAAMGREAFERDELIRTWIVHHLQIVGEACRAVSDEFKGRHPEVEWSDATGMRNVLVHEYFGVQPDLVWSVVENDLPDLKRKVGAILDELGEGDGAS